MDTISVEAVITPSHIRGVQDAWYRQHLEAFNRARRTRSLASAGQVAVGFAGAFFSISQVVLWFERGAPFETRFVASLILAGVVLVLVFVHRTSSKGKANDFAADIEAQVQQMLLPGVIGNVTLDFDEQGVRYRSIGVDVTTPWESITGLVPFEQGVGLSTLSQRLLIIPDDACTPEQLSTLVGRAERAAASFESDRPHIRAFLREHVVACAQCGYLLKNAASDVCPECGRRVEPEDLAKGLVLAEPK